MYCSRVTTSCAVVQRQLISNFQHTQASFSLLFFFGAVLIILAFIGVTVLDHYGAWDPLWVGMKKLFIMAKDAR